MSAASPEEAAEVEVSSALSSNFVTSALPIPRGPLLLPNRGNLTPTPWKKTS